MTQVHEHAPFSEENIGLVKTGPAIRTTCVGPAQRSVYYVYE